MSEGCSVLIDGFYLGEAKKHSGTASYVRNLLAGLSTASQLDIRVFSPLSAELPSGVTRLEEPSWLPNSLYEHELRRSLATRTMRADVFHNPNPYPPILPPARWTTTLHDLIPLLYDDPGLKTWRRWFRRFGRRYRRADRVIAVSRHAADEGIRHLGIAAGRVEVIHHGVSPEFTPAASWEPADPPYISFVGEFSRRKGHREAFAIIDAVADAGLPHRLKVAGLVHANVRDEFDRILAGARHRDRIDLVGFAADLPDIYRRSSLHLVTSRYEGFGFPALEAMASGTPVVAFDNSSIPEVVGDGGVLVPDGDTRAAADAVIAVLGSGPRRDELARAARSRAQEFSWERSWQAHAEVFQAVAQA